MIGVNAAMHALGVLAMALVLPRLVPRIGARRMTLGALVLAGVVLALFPADRRRLAIILGLVATGGALFWPAVLNHPWIAYPVLFLWGGVFVGIFTLMMTLVGSRFDGADLVGIYAVMGLVWGVGALLGPALAGISMDFLPHGLPIFTASATLAFTVYAATSRSAA